jgi:hypothetical protein
VADRIGKTIADVDSGDSPDTADDLRLMRWLDADR